MSNSILTDEQKYEMNYGVPVDQQQEAAKKLKKMGVNVRSMEITIWLVDGKYISPATMIKRLEEGYYASKETAATIPPKDGDAEVAVPTHKRRSTRPVGPSVSDVPKSAKRVRGDSDKRVSKQKGTRGNGSGTRKNIRGRDTEPEKISRKATKVAGKRGTRLPVAETDNNTRETRVERRRRLGLDFPKSRGVKPRTRLQRKASRR